MAMNEFMEEYTRLLEVFRTCCTNYGTEDRPFCDECPYSDLIIESLASNGEVMFCDYTECETALCTRIYELMEEQTLKNAAYKKAEEQGRLVILPWKIGDKVFRVIPKCLESYINCSFVGGHGLDRCPKCDAYIQEESFDLAMFKNIGKTVFLTREEAESALNGGQDDADNT